MSSRDEQVEHAYAEAAAQPARPRPGAGIAAKLVEVTPQMAEQLLKRNTHNRSMNAQRVRQYAADMVRGDWQLNGEAIKLSASGKILDGQHRLAAVLESNQPIQTLLISGLPDEAQETMDQGRARTFADVLKLRGEQNVNNLAAATGTAFIYARDRRPYLLGTTKPTVKQLSHCLERNPELRDSVRIGVSYGAPWLGISDTGALHFLLSSIDEDDASDFLHKVCTGDGHRAVDATYVLRERLIKEHYGELRLDRRVRLAFVVKAWNAYRTGDTLTRLMWVPGGAHAEAFPAINGWPDGSRP